MLPLAENGVSFKMGLVHVAVGGGLLAIGYHLGRRFSRSALFVCLFVCFRGSEAFLKRFVCTSHINSNYGELISSFVP